MELQKHITLKRTKLLEQPNTLYLIKLYFNSVHFTSRDIFSSQEWSKSMEHSYSLTNLYVLLKKSFPNDVDIRNKFFLPLDDFTVPNKTRKTTISLNYEHKHIYNCCGNVSVFEDSGCCSSLESGSVDSIEDEIEDDGKGNECWFQAKVSFKGYKDCLVDKTSVTNLF